MLNDVAYLDVCQVDQTILSRDLRICCARFPTPGSAAIFVSDLSRRNSLAIITGAPEI